MLDQAIAALTAGAQRLSSLRYAVALALITSALLAVPALQDASGRELVIAILGVICFMVLLRVFHHVATSESKFLAIASSAMVFAVLGCFVVTISALTSHLLGFPPRCIPLLQGECNDPEMEEGSLAVRFAKIADSGKPFIDARYNPIHQISPDRNSYPVMVTAPFDIANVSQPAKTLRVDLCLLVTMGGWEVPLQPQWIVNIGAKKEDNGILKASEYSVINIDGGSSTYMEVGFFNQRRMTWGEFTDMLNSHKLARFEFGFSPAGNSARVPCSAEFVRTSDLVLKCEWVGEKVAYRDAFYVNECT